MAKVYEIAFEMGGQITSTFTKSMRGANSALGDLQKQIKDLNTQQGDIGRLTKLQKSVGQLSREFNDAQREAQRLGKELTETAEPTKKQQREFERARQKASKLKSTLADQRMELHKLRGSMGATGKNTRQLAKEQQDLARATEKARKAQASLQQTMARQEANLARREDLRGQMLDAAGLAVALGAPIRMAANWEQSLAELNKVAAATPQELKAISNSAQELAVNTGVAREEILSAYTAAAQAGFARNEWAQFAETSAKMGVAFDTTGEKAGEMLKAWRSGMKLTMDEATLLAGAANHLANNMNATAIDIGEVVQRQGAILKSAGLNAQDSAALSAALLSGGASPEIAATAGKNFVLALTKGAAATAGQQDALAALGFDDPQELAKRMQEAPREAITEVLKSIRELSADEQTAIMTRLFGSESIGAIAPLISNLENLQRAFGLVAKEQQFAMSLQEEFNALQSTTNQQAKKAREGLKAMGTAIGATLLPAINSMLEAAAPMALKLAQLAEQYPLVTKLIVGTAAAMMALKVASIAGAYAWTFVAGAGLKLKKVVDTLRIAYLLNTGAVQANSATSKKSIIINKAVMASQKALAAITARGGMVMLAKSVIPAVIAGFKALSVAMLTNPIGWILTGIAVAALLIYKNWAPIKEFFIGFWDGLTEGIAPLMQELSSLMASLGPVSDALSYLWTQVKTAVSWFGSLFEQTEYSQQSLMRAGEAGRNWGNSLAIIIKAVTAPMRMLWTITAKTIEIIGNLGTGVKNAWQIASNFIGSINLYESGQKILDTLIAGVKSKANEVVKSVKGVFAQVREYMPFSDAKVGPFSELTKSGAAIMTTLADGVNSTKALQNSVNGQFSTASPSKSLGSMASGVANSTDNSKMVLHVEQHISIGSEGSPAGVEQQARSGARQGLNDAVKELENIMQQKRRLSYA